MLFHCAWQWGHHTLLSAFLVLCESEMVPVLKIHHVVTISDFSETKAVPEADFLQNQMAAAKKSSSKCPPFYQLDRTLFKDSDHYIYVLVHKL